MLAAMARLTPVSDSKPTRKQSAPPPKLEGPCDKCDGSHHESQCPYFKNKERETHPDAQERYRKSKSRKEKTVVGGEAAEEEDDDDAPVLLPANRVRVIAQPGDGSCLFHSLSSGRSTGSAAGSSAGARQLRCELEDYIAAHPMETIGDTPIADWVLWDTQSTVATYAARMRAGNDWGGAIEIAVFARIKRCEVHVYERTGGGFGRISRFLPQSQAAGDSAVSILYGGRCHYDLLVLK
jgi:hypothetical protein